MQGISGSHTCVELLNHGYDVVILDNLCNSSPKAVERIAQIAGKDPYFIRVICWTGRLWSRYLTPESIDAVIHFAGLKAVGESVENL